MQKPVFYFNSYIYVHSSKILKNIEVQHVIFCSLNAMHKATGKFLKTENNLTSRRKVIVVSCIRRKVGLGQRFFNMEVTNLVYLTDLVCKNGRQEAVE